MKELKDIEIGDTVYVDGMSSFCASSAGEEKVTNVKTKYDEDTGEPYKVICCGNHHFDSRDGWAIKGPSAYYIEPIE